MTKNPNNKPAQNSQSVFVLNFENWDLQIAWNLGFEYWNLVRLVNPFTKMQYTAKFGNGTFETTH